METAQHPAGSEEPVGGSGRQAAGPPPALRERVTAVFGPVAELLERLEETTPSGSSGTAPAPRLEAVRALLDGQVAGEWEHLAGLLVDPAVLLRRAGPTGTIAAPVLPDDPRAFFYEDYRLGVAPSAPPVPEEPEESGPQAAEPVPSSAEEIVHAALDSPHACLVRAADGPERTALLAALVRGLVAAERRTLLLAPSHEQVAGLLAELRRTPEVGTLVAEPSKDPDRPDMLSELRRLRRELLTLEQWPRDRAALEELRAHDERRRAELEANEQRLMTAIEAAGGRIEAAEQKAAQARERLTEVTEEHDRLAAEADRARSSWRNLQGIADGAAREADARTREADAVEARHQDLAQQVLHCERELEAARTRQAQLTDELGRARAALPEATRETEQLAAAAANATAEKHASYYRLAAAESAHTAQRRRLSWGQRLHVAPVPPEVEEARQLVKWRRREAQEAAERARTAIEAHQQAEALRSGLTRFMAEAEQELAALGQAQEHLGGRLTALVADRDAAHAEIRRLSRQVAEAVDHATQTATAARHAGRLAAEAEQRATTARQARDRAAAEAELATAEAAQARAHLADLEAELERHRTDAAAQIADLAAELRTLTEAEQHSRDRVRLICGVAADEEISPDLLSERRTRTMARIEELAAALDSTALLYATPLGFGRGPYSRGTVFDTLIVLDADRVDDAELLIGAIRARHWLLVADGRGRPPLPAEASGPPQDLDPAVYRAATDHLGHSAFERCLTAAPALCRDLTVPHEGDRSSGDPDEPPAPADATLPLGSLAAVPSAEEPPATGTDGVPADSRPPADEQPADADSAPLDPPTGSLPPAGEQPAPADAPLSVSVPADERPTVRPDDPTHALPVPAEGPNAEHRAPADGPPPTGSGAPAPAAAPDADRPVRVGPDDPTHALPVPTGSPEADPPPPAEGVPPTGSDGADRRGAVPGPEHPSSEGAHQVGGPARPADAAFDGASSAVEASQDDPVTQERSLAGEETATGPEDATLPINVPAEEVAEDGEQQAR